MIRRGEFEAIRAFQRGSLVSNRGVVRGIGDDAAVFEQDGDRLGLITTCRKRGQALAFDSVAKPLF